MCSLIDAMIEEAKTDLHVSGKTRDAAAELLSRLLTRPDMESKFLKGFLEWATQSLAVSDDVFLVGH